MGCPLPKKKINKPFISLYIHHCSPGLLSMRWPLATSKQADMLLCPILLLPLWIWLGCVMGYLR